MSKDTHAITQKSRRGAGQDDWGKIDIKVVYGLVSDAKAKRIEGLVMQALDDLQEEITGQLPMLRDGEKPKPPDKPVRGQRKLPGIGAKK